MESIQYPDKDYKSGDVIYDFNFKTKYFSKSYDYEENSIPPIKDIVSIFIEDYYKEHEFIEKEVVDVNCTLFIELKDGIFLSGITNSRRDEADRIEKYCSFKLACLKE